MQTGITSGLPPKATCQCAIRSVSYMALSITQDGRPLSKLAAPSYSTCEKASLDHRCSIREVVEAQRSTAWQVQDDLGCPCSTELLLSVLLPPLSFELPQHVVLSGSPYIGALMDDLGYSAEFWQHDKHKSRSRSAILCGESKSAMYWRQVLADCSNR